MPAAKQISFPFERAEEENILSAAEFSPPSSFNDGSADQPNPDHSLQIQMPRDALHRHGQPQFSAAGGRLRRDPDSPARHRLEGHAGEEKPQGGFLTSVE